MKVCLYGELSRMLLGSGIGSAIDHQEKALKLNGVEVTRDPKDEYDLIDINTLGPHSAYVAHKKMWNGIPLVIHSHTTVEDLRNSFKYTNNIAPKLRGYLRYFYSQADLIIAPSEYTKTILRDYGVRRDVRVISNGVDTDRLKPNERLRREFRKTYGLRGVVVYSVGHIFKRKGIIEFIDVAKVFPEAQFIWVGRNYRGLVDAEIKEAMKNQPENVAFTGYVKDVVGAYCGGDIFLFPSWCENQGISILEAAACKKPLVLRNLPTYDGWLEHGKNCLKARNNSEFEKHITHLMEDKKLAARYGRKAYDMSRKHTLKKVGAELKKAYETLL